MLPPRLCLSCSLLFICSTHREVPLSEPWGTKRSLPLHPGSNKAMLHVRMAWHGMAGVPWTGKLLQPPQHPSPFPHPFTISRCLAASRKPHQEASSHCQLLAAASQWVSRPIRAHWAHREGGGRSSNKPFRTESEYTDYTEMLYEKPM